MGEMITTTKTTPDNPTGLMDVDTPGLVKNVQVIEDDEKKQIATEYHLHGELVHRSVHIDLKKWPEGMGSVIASFQ